MDKEWVIFDYDGRVIGKLSDDLADDEKDAVLNWADESLHASLEPRGRF